MKTGERPENFALTNTEGEKVSLHDLIENQKVLLLFFPFAFSDVCTGEMCTMRDNMKMYNSLDANVVGISVDSFFSLRAFKKANNLNFILLSDFNKEVSRQFNCLYDDYFGAKGVSKRSAFVINQEGIIEYSEILDDSDKLPDFKGIYQALKS